MRKSSINTESIEIYFFKLPCLYMNRTSSGPLWKYQNLIVYIYNSKADLSADLGFQMPYLVSTVQSVWLFCWFVVIVRQLCWRCCEAGEECVWERERWHHWSTLRHTEIAISRGYIYIPDRSTLTVILTRWCESELWRCWVKRWEKCTATNYANPYL